MLFQFDDLIANNIIQQHLTASQQSILLKQGMGAADRFLLLKPLRYIQRQYNVSLSKLPIGQVLCLIGKIRSLSKRRVRRNLMVFQAMLHTEYEQIPLVWFNQRYIVDKLANDPWVSVYGKLDESQLTTSFQVTSFGHIRLYQKQSLNNIAFIP